MTKRLEKIDPYLAGLIKKEIERQKFTIDLIPSEAIAPKEVLEVLGSPLVNKYSEGGVGCRYYPGNEYIDKIESLAKKRAKEVFGLGKNWEVNVQLLSGTPANLAVYFGLCNPGDRIMGMSLFSGGHLSHGHPVSLSGKIFNSITYSLRKDGYLDFDHIEKIAKRYRPKIIISGFSAYPRKVDFKKFYHIAKEINAYHMADISHIAGLIIAKVHPSPFKYADIVTTTCHKTLNGPRAAIVFYRKELKEKIDKAVFPGMQGGPHNNKIAAIALSLKIAKTKAFKNTMKQIVKNAKTLAEELKKYGFNLITNGTDTHLMLIDLRNKDISGKEAEKMLEKAGILVNRNAILEDKKPYNPSGLRPGTVSVSFRKMREKEMKKIANWISEIIDRKRNPIEVRKEVVELCKKFPLPY